MEIRSKALRESARGEECTLQIIGICNHDRSTTVLAHLPSEWKGMGNKSPDLGSAVYACYACHDRLDSRNGIMSQEDKLFYSLRGLQRTIVRMYEKGTIQIKGGKG